MRPLEGDEWLKTKGLVLESLPKGKVPASHSSPCTGLPGRGKGRCGLNSKNYAGHVARSPPVVFPGDITEFGVASAANETKQQDRKS
ncbi:hypothetical protein GIB67_039598 [Kingdonia uniflora]|uniref:Uncharacterized protein n=1 Tax=Kingdonia uniflora TaxID=39325 RepID=A0A7J7P6T1_9MAGN|nr:hypothetical protein GIB67_039598 [Kingdonia uniflora]